jgi:hypothetical protein
MIGFIVRMKGRAPTLAECKQIVKILDIDGDGVVSPNELKEAHQLSKRLERAFDAACPNGSATVPQVVAILAVEKNRLVCNIASVTFIMRLKMMVVVAEQMSLIQPGAATVDRAQFVQRFARQGLPEVLFVPVLLPDHTLFELHTYLCIMVNVINRLRQHHKQQQHPCLHQQQYHHHHHRVQPWLHQRIK